MHISFYRRPLFLVLILYAMCLALFLKVPQPPDDIIFAKEATVDAVVISFPRSKGATKMFEANILSVNSKPADFNAYIRCQNCPQDILRGSKISFNGSLQPVDAPSNFGSFDWGRYLARRDVFAQGETDSIESMAPYSSFWVFIAKIRGSILDSFDVITAPGLLPILTGITIGEKGDIDNALYIAFQDSGAMHLLVASGGNVGFVTLIVYFLCSLFGAGRKTSAAAALVLAALYTLIAGADAPLLRAYLMTLCATAGFLMGRKSGVLQGLTLAALIILVVSPQSIFEAGFQMSFLATLAIILLSSNFKLFEKMHKFPRFILQLFFVSLVAQLALLPIFTNYFQKISLTAPISNIVLVPLSGVIMGFGFLFWLVSLTPLVYPAKAVLWALQILLIIFKWLVEFFASFSISRIITPALKPTTVIAYYMAFFAFMNRPIIKRKFLYTLFWCALILFVLFIGLFQGRSGMHILHGRYNKALIVKERGKIIVIGAGVQNEVLRRAALAFGKSKIDCLFLNSAAKNSVYALKDLEGIQIRNIYMPYSDIPAETQEIIQPFNAKGAFLWPGDNACGVTAAPAWYLNEDGAIHARQIPGANLSYEFRNYYTSGNLREIANNAPAARP